MVAYITVKTITTKYHQYLRKKDIFTDFLCVQVNGRSDHLIISTSMVRFSRNESLIFWGKVSRTRVPACWTLLQTVVFLGKRVGIKKHEVAIKSNLPKLIARLFYSYFFDHEQNLKNILGLDLNEWFIIHFPQVKLFLPTFPEIKMTLFSFTQRDRIWQRCRL